MRVHNWLLVTLHIIVVTVMSHQFCAAQNIQIAFVSNREGSHDIFVMDRMGNNLSNLTKSPDIEESFPSWSPDGTRIVFTAQLPGEEPDVYIMDSDGSNWRNVTNSPSLWEYGPSWSPISDLIAFSIGWGFRLMSSEGSNVRDVVGNLWSTKFCTWSPDGTRMAFLAGEPHRLFIADSGASNPIDITPIIEGSHEIGKPAFSPDGGRIVFASHPSLPIVDCFSDSCGPFLDLISSTFYAVDTNGERLTRLTQAPTFYKDYPNWVVDGRIIYTHYTGTNLEIYAMDTDGINLVNLTNHPSEDQLPAVFVDLRTSIGESTWGTIKHSVR